MNQDSPFSSLVGTAVLAIWNAVDNEEDAEFNAWYTHEHLPERVGIPGFLRGRRFTGADLQSKRKKYFTLYETENLETLTSPPYLERLNHPTEWTRRVIHIFKDSTRTACKVTASFGQGTGGELATVEFGPVDEQSRDLREWLRSVALPKVMEHSEIVAVHLCEADDQITRAKDETEENKSVGGSSSIARWLVVVEATNSAGLDAAEEVLCGEAGVRAHGASGDASFDRWRLMVSLAA
jgi:hypothetical protein